MASVPATGGFRAAISATLSSAFGSTPVRSSFPSSWGRGAVESARAAGYDPERFKGAMRAWEAARDGAISLSGAFGAGAGDGFQYGQPGFGGGAGSGEVSLYRRWRNLWTSPRQSVMRDLGYLISQSRYLARYHPVVKHNIATIVFWTVGKGFQHSISTTGMNAKAAANLKAAVKSDLETRAIDADGMLNVWQIDRLIEATMLVDGSIIVLMRRLKLAEAKKRKMAVPMVVELYGQDMVAVQIVPTDLKDGEEFRDGYAVDVASRRRIAIYMYDRHPSESGVRTFKRLPIWDSQGFQQIFHYFDVDRSGAMTGTPRAVSVVDVAHNMADYNTSLLDRMREDSKITRYIKAGSNLVVKPNLMGTDGPLGGSVATAWSDGVPGDGAIGAPPPPVPGAPLAEMSWDEMRTIGEDLGAMFLDNNTAPLLPPGWDVKEGQTTPTNGFPDYFKELLRYMATGMGVPYNLGANDQKGGSFSADKISLSTFKAECEARQLDRITGWRADLWGCWFRSGAIVPIEDGGWAGQTGGSWNVFSVPFPVIEPVAEANAAAILLDKGLAIWSDEVTRRTGLSADEVEERIVADAKRKGFAEIGVVLKPLGYLAKGGSDPNATQASQGGASASQDEADAGGNSEGGE